MDRWMDRHTDEKTVSLHPTPDTVLGVGGGGGVGKCFSYTNCVYVLNINDEYGGAGGGGGWRGERGGGGGG